MKTKNLEYISGKTCVWKIQAMMTPLVTESMVKCRYRCDNNFQKECNSYRPVELYNIRIKGMREYYRGYAQ